MRPNGEAKLLRIFIGECDTYQHKPLYHEIVTAAQRAAMAGATVLRGIEGFGANSVIHTTRILSLSEDLPLVIEIVDTADKVDAFLAQIEPMVTEGMITTERVQIHLHRPKQQDPA